MAFRRIGHMAGQDLRSAVRRLVRQPGLGLLAAATVGVGLAASLVMVVLVRDILLRPLPFPEPERLVRLQELSDDEAGRVFWPSWPNIADWREHAHVLDGVAAAAAPEPRPLVLPDRAVLAPVGALSRGFLDVVGVRPTLGRAFSTEENAPGGAPVALVSWRFWQTELRGQPLAGLSFTLGDERYLVVGVLPEDFRFLARGGAWGAATVWTPLERSARLGGRTTHGYHAVARLADGVSLEQAAAELNLLAVRLKEAHGEATHADRIRVAALLDDVVGGTRRPLRLLLVGAFGVLLVACMNLAGALLAQGLARTRELSIRLAMGASRAGLSRQLLFEALLLAIPGLAAGTALAWATLRWIRTAAAASLPRLEAVGLDNGDIVVAAGIGLAAAVTAGLLPALTTARRAAGDLRTHGAISAGRESRALWWSFVAGQAAVTMVLLVGCGLLLRSLIAAVSVDVGYDPHEVLAVQIGLPESLYESPQRRLAFYDEVLSRARALPGVRAVGITNVLTHETDWPSGPVGREGDPGTRVWSSFRRVNGGYFEVLRIPHLRGDRLPRPQAGVPGVLIDRGLAERLWPDGEPLGERIDQGATVAGVVGSVRKWNQDTGPGAVYLDYRAAPEQALSMYVLVRHEGGAAPVARAVNETITAVDPLVPISIQPMIDAVRSTLAERRLMLSIAVAFAAVTLLLAIVGVYALVAFAVRQRLREAAVRVALGARPTEVSRRLMRHGVSPAIAGLAVGAFGSIPAASALRAQLFHVQRFDPPVFAGAALVLAAAAAIAAWAPARLAGQVEPAKIFRQE